MSVAGHSARKGPKVPARRRSVRCPCCDPLRREVAELRRVLGLAGDASLALDFQIALRLTPTEARIVAALFEAGQRVVPFRTLGEIACPANPEGSALRVHVRRVREVLGHDAILTDRSAGYRLSLNGRLQVGTQLAVLRARRAIG